MATTTKGKKGRDSSVGGKVSKSGIDSVVYDGDKATDNKNTEEALHTAMMAKRRGEVIDFSLEATGRTGSQKGKFKTFKIPKVGKNDASKKLIRAALDKNVLFNDLTEVQFELVVGAMSMEKVKKGTKLITEGSLGDNFYIVNSGKFSFKKKGEGILGEAVGGDSFGELALLYNAPRAVTVVCEENAEIWTLDRETFRQIVSRSQDTDSESIRQALLNAPIFQGLTDDQIEALVDAVHLQIYNPGDIIIKKGGLQRIFYIIKEGEVIVTKAGKNLNELEFGKGDYFGEAALLNNEPRAANVIAKTKVECLALDGESFHEILGDLKKVLSHNFGIRVLKSVPLFADLSDHQHEKMYDHMKVEKFEKGKPIIKQGDLGRKFYIIKEGQVEVLKQNVQKKSTLKVTTLNKGNYFGEGALISDEPRAADIIATTEVQCFTINRQSFEELFGGPLKQVIEEENKRRNKELHGGKKVFHKHNIKFNDLKILKTLGTGTFGRVRLVLHEKTGKTYALKILRKAQIVQYRQISNVMNEKKVMKDSDHPFILKLFETYKDPQCLYMLLELIQGGELFNLLQNRGGRIPNNMARFYAACVIDAFHYLHDRYIVYRDLKPENLMIDTTGYIRVVDFGFAKKVKKKTYTLCGTPEYLAPEIVLGKGHNRGVDLWAIGILIYEMLQGQSPFADVVHNDQMTICKKIVKGTYAFPKSFPQNAKEIVKAFLKRDPSHRLGMQKGGARDIKAHEWFNSFSWELLRAKELSPPWVPTIKDPLDTSNFEEYEEEEIVEHYEDDDEGRWDKF